MKLILAEAGFPLRKWVSNNQEFLSRIPLEHQEGAIVDNDEEPQVSILGMIWYFKIDKFGFKFKLENHLCLTKRSIFSEMYRIYDPLGLLSPIIVSNKILMKSIWDENIDWEETVSENNAKQWKIIRSQINLISNIRINRWIQHTPNCRFELHGFADASKKAYAAVVYSKTWIQNSVYITIITAKTRITKSSKEITLPRNELNAALLLATLMKSVRVSLKLTVSATFYYSDSQITLAWIKSPSSKWKTYVANRVEQIYKVSEINHWYYVASKHNPADCASRGQLPEQLIANELWWKGPEWLHSNNYTKQK